MFKDALTLLPAGQEAKVGRVVPMEKRERIIKKCALKTVGEIRKFALTHALFMDTLQTLIAMSLKVNTLMITLQKLKLLLF